MTEINPYTAPADVELQADEVDKFVEPQPTSLTRALVRWSCVCVVGTAPSFYFGLGLSNHPLEVPAMLIGVAAFVLAYTAIAVSRPSRRLMSSTRIRRAIYTAYGLRVAVSICFPIAMMNDMMCGILSVGVTGQLIGAISIKELETFWQILITTIVQGILLNGEIIALILLFLGAAAMWDAAHRAFVRHRSKHALRELRRDMDVVS